MTETFTKFDVTDYLKTEADIEDYLEAAMEDGDPHLIAATLGDIARAKAMAKDLKNGH